MFSDKIAAMGQGYLERTERRLAGLLEQVEARDVDVGEARRTFHDIVGTAPVFGFAELGEQARDAEELAMGLDPAADASGLSGPIRGLLHLAASARIS